MFRSMISAAALLTVACAHAQEPAETTTAETATPASQPVPCSSDAHRAFDFWLGTWTVTDPAGNVAGENTISSQERGCLLLEVWTSAGGGTGQSYNFLDPKTEKWRQVWVSTGAVIDYSGGLTATGSMKLEGEITYQGTGLTAPFTGEWTPNADGTVTQHFEQYDAENDTWNPWFTGLYTRKETADTAD